MTDFRFDAAEFLERAQTRLLATAPMTFSRSDDDLNPDARAIPYERAMREAAVLVPIVAREPEVTVLMIRRNDALRSHSGQIAFPGGKLEEIDGGPVDAALREAEEETGLPRMLVEPKGFLDGYLTRTAYQVVPVVALVTPGFSLNPDPVEVADIFEVPLRFLMGPENHLLHSRDWQGKSRSFYAMPYGERYIWGATAGMIKNLYDRMYATP
jgi:8-oxo-dGTP pyrophosphatase MutT (NUDIX family)